MNLSQPPELSDPRLKDWLYLLWKKVIENQNSESQASVLSVSNGGTGKASLTGYLIGNGASPFTAIGKIPYSDLSGAPQNKSYGLNIDALDKTAAPGIYVITNFGSSATRTITGTTDRISITNGDGVSGNPTINIAATYIGQNTITTLGTITTGVWQGTSISTSYTDAKLKTLTGTSNRISISGTSTDPIVDISATYVGQASITTLGTITTGTWNAGQITSSSTITCTAGTSSGQPILIGKLNVNTTVVGNIGGGTDDLMTYSLPANSLASTKGVRIKAWGTFANNANAKTLTFNFGSKTISLSTTILIDGAWASDIIVFSTGSNAQIIFIDHKVTTLNSTVSASNALYEDTATQTDSSSITIKYTAVGTADNDVTQKGMLIEFFN